MTIAQTNTIAQYFHNGLYIDGQWQQGAGEITNVNPGDVSDVIGVFPQASITQVEQAIAAAHSAQPVWERTALEQRSKALQNIGDELIARCDELGDLLSREEGKTAAEGRGEVYRAGQFFHYFAAEVLRQIGDLAESVRPDIHVEVSREAVGVVAIISPWNFPTATAAWKIAPALAFGNSVIWKPANATPASAVALTEIITRQNLPRGCFNLVIGSGAIVGDALIHSTAIDAVSFTGSVPVGRRVATATAPNFVRCQLEMGSKNALVIADDADIAAAVDVAVAGAYGGTGQKCTASSRLVVCESVHDRFVEAMIARLQTIKTGYYKDPDVFYGAVVDDTQLQSNLAWVERAKQLGSEVIGGERLNLQREGYYMSPALCLGSDNSWDINQEEIFAPLSSVIKVADLDQAIATVNDSRFGLTAGICTQGLKNAAEFKRRAQTGCVMVNVPTAGTDYHVPFGGRKESSFGPREQGSYAKEFYTIVKTSYVRPY